VRIVGPQVARGAHRVLDACLLEVDGRLNGPDTPIAGTQVDFAQRAARFVYDRVISSSLEGGVMAHRRALARRLAGMRLPRRHDRQSMSDDGIMKKIRALWSEVGGRSGEMLRVLRRREQIACEQGRFKNLFKLVQKDLQL
jgi:hypothetical protein